MIEPHGLRTRREEIARELDAIETRMATLVRHFEHTVRTRVSPSYYLRNHPLATFAASTLFGVLLNAVLGLGGKAASGGIIKQTVRRTASRWLARKVVQFLAGKTE